MKHGKYHNLLLNQGTKVQVKRENLPDFEAAVGTVIHWRNSLEEGIRDYEVEFLYLPARRGLGYSMFIDERYLTTEIEETDYELAIKVLGEDYF